MAQVTVAETIGEFRFICGEWWEYDAYAHGAGRYDSGAWFWVAGEFWPLHDPRYGRSAQRYDEELRMYVDNSDED